MCMSLHERQYKSLEVISNPCPVTLHPLLHTGPLQQPLPLTLTPQQWGTRPLVVGDKGEIGKPAATGLGKECLPSWCVFKQKRVQLCCQALLPFNLDMISGLNYKP